MANAEKLGISSTRTFVRAYRALTTGGYRRV